MSDLVEKVARGMYPSWWKTIDTCTDGAGCDDCQQDRAHTLSKARAAIKAVAEWIEHQEEGDLDFIKFQLRRAANEQ